MEVSAEEWMLTEDDVEALEGALIAAGPRPDDFDWKLDTLMAWATRLRLGNTTMRLIMERCLMADVMKMEDEEPIFRELKKA